MSAWQNLVVPGPQAKPSLLNDWAWLVGKVEEVVLITALGDAFVRVSDGSIHWIDTITGKIERVAASAEHFRSALQDSKNVEDWFMPGLVSEARSRGLKLLPGHCYAFKLPPKIGGEVGVDNLGVEPIELHFSVTGQVHQRCRDLPEGTPIGKITFTPNSNK